MALISLEVYKLYLKYGSECLWANDYRISRPKETTEITDQMFAVIENLDHKLEMVASGLYSKQLEDGFCKEIESLKSNFTHELFILMQNKYK